MGEHAHSYLNVHSGIVSGEADPKFSWKYQTQSVFCLQIVPPGLRYD